MRQASGEGRRRGEKRWAGLGVALVFLVAVAEYTVGPSLRLSALYLVPVCLVAWFSGLRAGAITAVAVGAAFLVTELAMGRSYPSPMFRYWNTGLRVCVSLSAAWAVSWLKRDLDRRGEFIERVNAALADRRRAQEELERKTRELARSNAELEEYACVAAHDLKSPLVAIGGYLGLLSRHLPDELDPEAKLCVAQALAGVKRMEELIDDLLAYSKVGAAEHVLEETDCNAVLERILANLAGAVAESGAEVTSDPLPAILFRKGQLDQLFQNLVGNAIKFHGSEPLRVHLSAARHDNEWVFSVRDNGIGVDPAHAEEIFGMFKRLSTGSTAPGTGIGLAVCKKIVEGYGGRIWVEPRPDQGSTFRFTVPLRE